MFNPVKIAEIPKNSKLNPIIIEITASEKIGNTMKIKPIIIDNNPIPLLPSMFSPPSNLYIY